MLKKITAGILLALDTGNLVCSLFWICRQCFNAAGHQTLLQQLPTSHHLNDLVTKWFISYLTGRMLFVCTSVTSSLPTSRVQSPTRVSPLTETDPFSAVCCCSSAGDKTSPPGPHTFNGDTQSYGFCRPYDAGVLSNRMTACANETLLWTRAN